MKSITMDTLFAHLVEMEVTANTVHILTASPKLQAEQIAHLFPGRSVVLEHTRPKPSRADPARD